MNAELKEIAEQFASQLKAKGIQTYYNGFGITEFKVGDEVISIKEFITDGMGYKPHKTWTEEYKRKHQVHPNFRI